MKFLYKFVVGILFATALLAQDVTTPRVSPPAEVKQSVGLASINISYSSPAVKGREIWGGLVKYSNIWRAGANENTVIELSHDAKVEGKNIPAGKYGFHIIPTENEWVLIFNSATTAWGSYFYNESDDILRVNIKPEAAPVRENLAYYFDNITLGSAMVYLHWGDMRGGFKVEFDRHAVVLDSFRKELVSHQWYGWEGPYHAASYCAANNMNQEEALKWVNRSIQLNRNFSNLNTKAILLDQTGKKEEAEEVKEAALKIATESELNRLGYETLNSGDVEGALKIFKINLEKNPESWNVYDSYAEALDGSGDKKNAERYYRMALEKAPDEQKSRIIEILKKYPGAN